MTEMNGTAVDLAPRPKQGKVSIRHVGKIYDPECGKRRKAWVRVDATRSDIDRAEARLETLAKRL